MAYSLALVDILLEILICFFSPNPDTPWVFLPLYERRCPVHSNLQLPSHSNSESSETFLWMSFLSLIFCNIFSCFCLFSELCNYLKLTGHGTEMPDFAVLNNCCRWYSTPNLSHLCSNLIINGFLTCISFCYLVFRVFIFQSCPLWGLWSTLYYFLVF